MMPINESGIMVDAEAHIVLLDNLAKQKTIRYTIHVVPINFVI